MHVYIYIYIYMYISNCLRPSRHRAQMCVPSALPLFRIGSRLHGQLFPSRLPALRGHTLSLVGRTLHTKSITKWNEKQNGTPANFENAPKFSCICLAVFPTVMKNKTECPTILKKMIPKWNNFYTHWHHFDPHRYHFYVKRRPFWPNRRPASKKYFFCRKHCVLRGCFS